jgi:hypothetical protein
MKRLSACVLLVLSAGLLPAQDADWSTFSSTDSKCEIKFPGKFQTLKRKGLAIGDPAQFDVTALLEVGGNTSYLLSIIAFPKDIAVDNKELVKKVMENVLADTLKNLTGSTLLKESEMTIGGFPARDVDIDWPSRGIYRAQLIVTPHWLYQVIVSGPKDFVEGADAKKFRASFKMKNEKIASKGWGEADVAKLKSTLRELELTDNEIAQVIVDAQAVETAIGLNDFALDPIKANVLKGKKAQELIDSYLKKLKDIK